MCCFFNTKTRKHLFLNAPTERNYLNTLFKNLKIDLVVMEACGPSGWINDLASSHGLKTLVCFTTGRQVSAYFGLVPGQYPSGETDHRKSRLRREAREAKAVADRPKKSVRTATAKCGHKRRRCQLLHRVVVSHIR
jgi:transposase